MNKTKAALLLISILFATPTMTEEKYPKKRKPGAMPAATAPAPKAIARPWEPAAFDQSTDRLTPDYSGIDPIRFFGMFKSKVGGLKKGDFETSEEFAQRIANSDALLSPINTIDHYAFLAGDIPVVYNADTQTYLIGGDYIRYLCKETHAPGGASDWVTCKVSAISRETGTYVGSNAYGISQAVTRTRGRDFSIAIAKGSAVLKAKFKQERYLDNAYLFEDRLPIPLEKARTIKDMKVAVLFVGRVTAAKIVEGRGTLKDPRLDSPTDTFISNEAVPFEVKKIIYYVVQTGEILGQRTY